MEKVVIISYMLQKKHLENGLITIPTVVLLLYLQEKYGGLRYNLVLVQYIWLFSLVAQPGKYIMRCIINHGALGININFIL